jgi:ferric-dicitrate binding protein FerR (iron transport regulator)
MKEHLLDYISGYEVVSGVSEDMAWDAIERKIAAREAMKVRFREPRGPGLFTWTASAAAAAMVAFIIMTGVFRGRDKTVSVATTVNRGQVTLPDGSVVELNAGSEINYNPVAFHGRRIIHLKGEAFFRVMKGRPFEVCTPEGFVTVLGTEFNVFSRDRELRVQCYSGRVKVSDRNVLQSAELDGGFETRLEDGLFREPVNIDTSEVASWRNGKLYFRNEPLDNVLEEAQRQFGRPVRYSGPPNRRYTGSFNIRDLDTALKLVCLPMQLSYEFRGDTIVISGVNN